MIATGMRLPGLQVETDSGERMLLPELSGEQGLLVFFMRTTTCPICNAHVRDLIARAQDLSARGISIVIAVPEARDQAAAWKARRGVALPVVVGVTGSAHEAVGLAKRVFGSIQQSGTVLVDRAGIVRYAHASTLPTGSYDRRAITAALDELVPAGRA